MASARFDDEGLDGGAHIVAVSGELDATTVGGLRRRLDDALADDHPRVIVDLSGVAHMDSSGLAVLLTAYQRAASLHGDIALVVTSDSLRRMFQIRGVDALFTLTATREEARAALAQ